MLQRREFLRRSIGLGAVVAVAGCRMNRLGFGNGGLMQDYAFKGLSGKKVRVGFVGIGARGTAAVHRVSLIPGVEIVALCDKRQVRIDENLKWLREHHYAIAPTAYAGAEAYKQLCDFGNCDVIYCATPWELHQPVAMRALCGGKIALVEVTSALTTEQCWELVETSERFRIPCMQLENCVYGEIELLELNMARLGMFGEIAHAEGAYIHDLRHVSRSEPGIGEWEWRYQENLVHKGNRYPTHGLTPICQTLGINRGDRLDYLVSLESNQYSLDYYRHNGGMAVGDPRRGDAVTEMGDMNITLIKTVNGRSIMIQHDVSSPRPYNRLAFISGTKGAMGDYPFRCAFETKCGDRKAHAWFDEKQAEDIRKKYMHPLWRDVSEVAQKVGGHGGMDFIMDLRWAYCLQNGLPLDMDVYDLAVTSCICELTETSVRNGSKPVSIPDFTRGNWKNVKPWGVVNVDLRKMGFDKRSVTSDDSALSV